MAKKLIDILSDAAVVRDETNEKANTAERVGGVLVELANYLSNFAPVSDVTVEADGANVRLVLHLKNEDGTVSTRGVTLPGATTANAGVLTPELLKALQAADRYETTSRQAADAELIKRIIGKSTSSSAYTDPFKYLDNFASEKDENGTVTKHAIRVMQDYLLGTLRHSDFNDSFPFIGHMRAHVEGVPIECWTYVKAWNTGSTNGVFVQVVRTNFGLNNGVISSALTDSFHEYFRSVTVGMANGSVTDVTATAWKESNADISEKADEGISKADAALAQIAAEAKERSAQDAALVESIAEEEASRDTAVSNERTARQAADAELLNRIIGKSTSSSAYSDPFKYLRDFASEKDASGTITKHAIRVMQDYLLDTLRHSDYSDSFPFIGHMRAHVEGVPIEMWNYVKAWNTDSTNGVFVQVVRTNFGLKGGVISSALTESFHEYFRTVTVAMANGSVTDVTATAWKESTVTDALLNQIQDHEDRIWKLENQWYGIEWDTEVSSPAVTRIGNMDLHRTLPIQSRMRGCLLNDNGKVVEYLNEKDWTGHDLSGAHGQVMVEIPSHYRRFETDGTKRRVKMSEYPLPGFNFVKTVYLSANEATIQRSTGKLASVVNTDPDFRGGNNQAEFDGTYKSVLGKPANYISLKTSREAARKRGQEGDTQWNCYTYDIHVTLTWLYVVEYANRNSQLPFTAELTSEGFHQGGLGSFSIPPADYNSYFKNLPIIPCGCTHHLGNSTGVVNLHLSTDDGTYQRDILVPRYRGVEVPFGHLISLADGILGKRADTSSAWTLYATSDPAVFGSEDTNQYRVVGLSPSAVGYIKDIHFGENGDITTSRNSGGSNTTFFCDFYENYSNIECILCFGGFVAISSNLLNGFFYSGYTYGQDSSVNKFTNRLCFLPAE